MEMDQEKNRQGISFLYDVENRLKRALEGGFAEPMAEASVLLEAARHLCVEGGGKRIRPRLVSLFGEALGTTSDALVDIAVASELIHSASLLHDDVVDEGTIRRGRPTVRALWDNHVSVLSGDLVLSLAFVQVKHLPFKVTERAVELVASMSRAAMMEVLARGRADLGLAAWHAIADGKTGALFGWCGEAVAWLVEETEAAARFQRCGRSLGIAFQMADDLKDLRGDDAKDRFADIRNRNPSCVLLQAANQSSSFARALQALWSQDTMREEDIAALGQDALALGAAEEIYLSLCLEVERALDALGVYKDRPGGHEIAQWGWMLCEHLKEGKTS